MMGSAKYLILRLQGRNIVRREYEKIMLSSKIFAPKARNTNNNMKITSRVISQSTLLRRLN
jgi:hypothetical protein